MVGSPRAEITAPPPAVASGAPLASLKFHELRNVIFPLRIVDRTIRLPGFMTTFCKKFTEKAITAGLNGREGMTLPTFGTMQKPFLLRAKLPVTPKKTPP